MLHACPRHGARGSCTGESLSCASKRPPPTHDRASEGPHAQSPRREQTRRMRGTSHVLEVGTGQAAAPGSPMTVPTRRNRAGLLRSCKPAPAGVLMGTQPRRRTARVACLVPGGTQTCPAHAVRLTHIPQLRAVGTAGPGTATHEPGTPRSSGPRRSCRHGALRWLRRNVRREPLTGSGPRGGALSRTLQHTAHTELRALHGHLPPVISTANLNNSPQTHIQSRKASARWTGQETPLAPGRPSPGANTN